MGAQDWKNKLDNLVKPTYESKYGSAIDNILSKITNREAFSYDFNADPLYQQAKDTYTKLGNEASMNAVANVSNMTGGYANSYAATAAAQANQQYLTQLNNMIPELYNAALNKYKMDSEDLYNQYSVYGNAEDRAYGQYRDNVSDYYADRDYYYSGYNNERNYEYQQNRDAIEDARYEANLAYQKARDAVADTQWNQTFDYNKQRDTVADTQWNQTFDYNKSRDQVADEQWNKNFEYQKYRDAVSDARYASQQTEKDKDKEDDTTSKYGDTASATDFQRYKSNLNSYI